MGARGPQNDYHEPYVLKKNWKANMKKVTEYIQEDGLRVDKAVALAFGVHEKTWFMWQKYVQEDEENGYHDTKLMQVYYGVIKANAKGERKMARKANEMALVDGNPEMVKFILERRYGYKKTSAKEVEVATKDDLNFNINIVDSKKEE